MWQQPKVNWRASDYFNISDYNRIKGNINEIRTLAEDLWAEFSFSEMGEDKTYEDAGFYADEINLFEENIENFKNDLVALPVGDKKTFYDNTAFIDYEELNRIESACLWFYENVLSAKNDRRRLAFTLGTGRF